MKQKIFRILADLRFAIFILLLISVFSILGTIIEQDQSIETYKLNYPLTNKVLGFLSWDIIVKFGLDHIYKTWWFLILILIFGASLLTCTFLQQLPALKLARRCQFFRSPSQFQKLNLSLKLLFIRLISFLALLFTFSQPYYSDKKINENTHNFIYLDNSMSLNTNDENGNKLNIAVQEIIQFAPKKATYSLLTNDEFLSNISKEEVNIYLKKLNFSTKNSYFGDKIRTLESKINNETNELNKIILITDFQQFNKNKNFKFTNVNTPLYLKKPDLKKKNNISIDSVFIKTNDRKGNLISVVIKNQGEEKTDIPIALFNASNLLNKQSFSIKKDRKKTIEFPVESLEKIKGKIEITYNDVFLFDNIFYFTLDTPQKTSILTIGKNLHSCQRFLLKMILY